MADGPDVDVSGGTPTSEDPRTLRRRVALKRTLLASTVIAGTLAAGHASAQSREVSQKGDPDKTLELRKEIEREARKSGFVAIPFGFYTPETGVGGGAAALYHFHLNSDRNSQVGTSVRYTQQNQLLVRIKPEAYWGDNHVKFDLNYDRFPNSHFGVGRTSLTTDEQEYLPITWESELDYDRRVYSRLFLGLRQEISHTTIEGVAPESGLVGSNGGVLSGVGLHLFWDDRDNANAPHRGSYLKVGMLRFDEAIGSDFQFNRYLVDLRHYIHMGGGHVLALWGLGLHNNNGQVPFYQLSLIGGKKVMRGFFEGRYRDNTLAAAQVEYRMPLVWRFGLAGFAGVADVAPGPDHLSFADPKFAGGGGLRFAISERNRLNARLDVGWAEGETNMYITFKEAF